jgi:glycosyltransferase involved in cell wall biosynthesis
MNILNIGPIDSRSGFTNSILNISKALAAQGHRVAVLSSLPLHMSGGIVPPQGVILIPGSRKYHWNPWYITKEWIGLIKDKFGTPDIVNIHGLYVPFQTALARLFIKEGWIYIVSSRGSFAQYAQHKKFFKKWLGNKLFLKPFIANAMAIHALCQNEAEDVRRFYPKAKIIIAPNGVDVNICSKNLGVLAEEETSKEELFENKCLILGFIGRIDVYHKGLDILLSAFKIIQETASIKIKLVLVGPFHSQGDEKKIRILIQSLKLPSSVILIGPKIGDEKYALLSSFDIFIHTSRFEGLPNAVLEAMACAKPVIVTPGTNMKELVIQSCGGWVCDCDPNSVASAVLAAVRDKKEITRKGEAARKFIFEHLTWDKVAFNYIQSIQAIQSR